MLRVILAVSLALMVRSSTDLSADDNWPQFRGTQAAGMGSGNPPVTWNTETGENIAWKTRIEGLGHSSPIVWNDRVYLTTAISASTDKPTLQTGWLGGTGEAAADQGRWSWAVLCLDLNTGEILWTKVVAEGEPTIERHLKATHANCTPATDGTNVVAFFGSEGLFCLDTDGNLLWSKDFGRLHSGPYNSDKLEWGFASSPVIHQNTVIVQCDCLNTKFVAVIDIKSGKEIRRIERDDVATWSTPAVFSHNGTTQIVCNGYKQMAGYDFETGEQLWTLANGGDVPVPTPLSAGESVILTNGHGRSPTYAVSLSARGVLTPDPQAEETPEGLTWWQPRDGSYMPTPIVIEDRLYTCNDNGRLAVRNVTDGELVYRERVGSGTYSASAVAAGGNIYYFNEAGEAFVIKAGGAFELVAEPKMNEIVMATPAISGDRLLVRGLENLYCIERK